MGETTKKAMKVGIYSPYFNNLGGGERYTLTLADHLSKQGHQVDLFWDGQQIIKNSREKFNLKLEKISLVEDIFSPNKNLFQKWQITRKYDLIFYLSDGSIPFLFAKKNLLHFQVPFKDLAGRSILNRLKFTRFSQVICNSEFTKKHIDKEYGVEGKVIYPPVAVEEFKPGKKENLILSVGRFTQAMHAKKQHVLIEAFKKLTDQGLKNWRLVLVGGALRGDQAYLDFLKKLSQGYAVGIKANLKFKPLRSYYSQAKIYWHAAGFEEDENLHPERTEHFGIALVEAMAAGSVPVVISKGGIPEIVKDNQNGFLWNKKEELKERTVQLTKSQALRERLSAQAIKDSQKFSQKVFCRKFDEIIKD